MSKLFETNKENGDLQTNDPVANANRGKLVDEEFGFRPVPMLVPISMFLAASSATAYLGAFGVIVGIIATITSLFSLWYINRSKGVYTGAVTATVALSLSLLFTATGTAFIYYLYSNEVPKGYERVSFYHDISKPGVAFEFNQVIIPKDVLKLKERNIFIKGFMYPQRQKFGLKSFLLLKDTGQCCFGGKPKQSDMILVKIPVDASVDHQDMIRVSIGGKFLVKQDKTAEGLEPLYQIECSYFARSQTQF